MKRFLVLAGLLAIFALPARANVTTDIYATYTCCAGGGAPYSDFVGSLSTPGITFATDTGYNWHPFGLGSFGAEVFATLSVPTTGTYTFHLSSDDGAVVFVDGSLLIDRGGPHGPSTTDGTLPLTAGDHDIHVQFFECCGGPSGLDFSIPVGTVISTGPSVPEPMTLAILGAGLAGLGFIRRRKSA